MANNKNFTSSFTTNDCNTENNDLEQIKDVVTVEQSQLTALMEQNKSLKADVGQLVGLFLNFEGLFNGKSGLGSLIITIPKLINDPKMKAKVEAILPIIQKYK